MKPKQQKSLATIKRTLTPGQIPADLDLQAVTNEAILAIETKGSELETLPAISKDQLPIPMKKPKNEMVYGIRRKVNKSMTYAGVIPFWRNFYFVLAFLTNLFTVVSLSGFLYFNYERLPNNIPLIYNQATKLWTPVNKQFLLVIVFTLLIFLIWNTYLNSKIFQFDRRLVHMLNISVVMSCIILLVALSQIMSLLLVY